MIDSPKFHNVCVAERSYNCLQELSIARVRAEWLPFSHSHQLLNSGGTMAEQNDDTHQEADVKGKDKLQPGILIDIHSLIEANFNYQSPSLSMTRLFEE